MDEKDSVLLGRRHTARSHLAEAKKDGPDRSHLSHHHSEDAADLKHNAQHGSKDCSAAESNSAYKLRVSDTFDAEVYNSSEIVEGMSVVLDHMIQGRGSGHMQNLAPDIYVFVTRCTRVAQWSEVCNIAAFLLVIRWIQAGYEFNESTWRSVLLGAMLIAQKVAVYTLPICVIDLLCVRFVTMYR